VDEDYQALDAKLARADGYLTRLAGLDRSVI
jgi:hypothetical protein